MRRRGHGGNGTTIERGDQGEKKPPAPAWRRERGGVFLTSHDEKHGLQAVAEESESKDSQQGRESGAGRQRGQPEQLGHVPEPQNQRWQDPELQ